MTIHIRPEQPADVPRIFEVTELAFRSAAHTCGREQHLVNALRDAGALTLSLVAVLDAQVVGHVAASPVTVSQAGGEGVAGAESSKPRSLQPMPPGVVAWPTQSPPPVVEETRVQPHSPAKVECSGGGGGGGGWFGIGPVSVLPQRQRQGIGSRLMETAVARLRAMGARGCVLVGDPRFYTRFGFRSDPTLSVPGVPPEVTLALRFIDCPDRGEVTFHRAFLEAMSGG